MKSNINRLLILCNAVFFIVTLASCTSTGETIEVNNAKASAIYARAKDSVNVGDFESAIQYLEQLESRFPFSTHALQAQLDLIYAYYKFNEKEAAISQAERFERFNPSHPQLDYVIYMKGVVQQNDRKGLFDRWVKPKREDYDVNSLKSAYTSFKRVLTRFPTSIYVPDAHQRLLYIRDTLANHELQVAKFYVDRYQYVAAANRAKEVISNFPATPAARQALITLKQAYTALDMHDLADKVETVIAAN